MRINKLFTMLILMCLSVLFCFGCADLEAFRMIDPYSEESVITDKFVVTLDKNKLGDDFVQVKNAVYDDMVAFRNYVSEWIKQYEDEHQDVYLSLKESIVCDVVSTQENVISVTLGFADEYSFAMFYGVVGLEDETYTKAMNDVGPFLSQI